MKIMCGNIRRLRFPDRMATDAEVEAAVLQFVRKISNMNKPSQKNAAAFEATRHKMEASIRTMLSGLTPRMIKVTKETQFRATS